MFSILRAAQNRQEALVECQLVVRAAGGGSSGTTSGNVMVPQRIVPRVTGAGVQVCKFTSFTSHIRSRSSLHYRRGTVHAFISELNSMCPPLAHDCVCNLAWTMGNAWHAWIQNSCTPEYAAVCTHCAGCVAAHIMHICHSVARPACCENTVLPRLAVVSKYL